MNHRKQNVQLFLLCHEEHFFLQNHSYEHYKTDPFYLRNIINLLKPEWLTSADNSGINLQIVLVLLCAILIIVPLATLATLKVSWPLPTSQPGPIRAVSKETSLCELFRFWHCPKAISTTPYFSCSVTLQWSLWQPLLCSPLLCCTLTSRNQVSLIMIYWGFSPK